MSVSFSNWGLWIATATVLVGVALEATEIFHEVKEKGWKNLETLKKVEAIGFALVVIGLAFEWIFSAAMRDQDDAVIEAQQREILSLLPRDLTDEQMKDIGFACAKFADHGVTVSTEQTNGEASHLGLEIIKALKRGGFEPRDFRQSFVLLGPYLGVAVSAPPSEKEAIGCLENALGRIGHLAVTHQWPNLGPNPQLTVWVYTQPYAQ